MNYAGRGGAAYLSEGGGEDRNAYGNIAAPQNGYLWDAAARAGVSVRSYGEFALPRKHGGEAERAPGAASGRNRPSSSWRATPRTVRTTWTPTALWPS